MKPPLLLYLALTFCALKATAQGPYCLTDRIWSGMVRNDSSLYYRRVMMDSLIEKQATTAQLRTASARSSSKPVVIPTVFYIVNDGTPASNISMQQIQSQMDQLNANYTNYGVQFCYAKRNVTDTSFFVPQAGDSAGVFRITNALTNVDQSQDGQLKALSTLPSASYMRVFVVNNITPTGILGYALFPGSSVADDGIVVRADVFGSNRYCPSCTLYPDYNLGAVLTHEVGHFLNLYHTFQGGCFTNGDTTARDCVLWGDLICDTPPTTGNFGCPTPAPISCDGIRPVLINNYMDYTDDSCKNEFTAGQSLRMYYSILAYRQVLISTINLINTGVTCTSLNGQYANFDCNNYNGCLNDTMTFTSLNANGFTYQWDFGDGTTATGPVGYHAYASNGQFFVTLTAIDNSLNINENSSTEVFITPCSPIHCAYNRWEFHFGYLDFSSGTPIATNHVSSDLNNPYADYFAGAFRGDSTGKPLFNIDWYNNAVCDTSLNVVDTLVNSLVNTCYFQVVPCPSGGNKFCVVGSEVTPGAPEIVYSIVQANNGQVSVLPNRRIIRINMPNLSYYVHPAAIPNCDGTKFWILFTLRDGSVDVYELDNNDSLSYHSNFTVSGSGVNVLTFVASPDGRKLCEGVGAGAGDPDSLYIFDFDKSSGNITSFNSIAQGTPLYPDGSVVYKTYCFSPNSRFVYAPGTCCTQATGGTNYIYQYDLYNANPAASRKVITSFPYCQFNTFSGPETGLTIGPDKKMYVGYFTSPGNLPQAYRLSVINFPDVLENGLNSTGFNANGPNIKPPNCPYIGINSVGYMDFSDHYYAYGCDWYPGVVHPFTYFPVGCTTHQFHSDDCFSHLWHFGDAASGAADTSTLTDPVHTFSGAGSYAVTLDINGQTFVDTIQIAAPLLQLVSSPLTSCSNTHGNYSVGLIQPDVKYSWTVTNGSPASATNYSNIDIYWNHGDTAGLVKVVAIDTVTGCTDSISVPVTIAVTDSAFIHLSPSGNVPVCNGSTVQLMVQSTGDTSYIWYLNGTLIPGHDSSTYSTTHLGQYYVKTIDTSGCRKLSNTVTIISGDSVPIALTPSGNVIACSGGTVSFSVVSGASVYHWYLNDTLLPGVNSSSYTASVSGTYSVNAMDTSGCTLISNAVQLNIFDSLNATIVSAIDSVCEGDTSAFSIALTPNANYTWTVSGGSVILGAGTDSVLIKWTAEGGATITVNEVLIANNDSCVSNGVHKLYVSACGAGINAPDNLPDISIIPNPVKENFTINSAQIYTGQLQMILCNSLGQIIEKNNYTVNAEKLNIAVSCEALAQGVYFVVLKTSEAAAVKKIIKY